MSKLFYDPQHWREKAKDIRARADECASEVDRDMLSRIAAEYEQIADRAEERRPVSEAEQQDISPAGTKHATP